MGAGALGCLFGYLIQRSGYDVIFIARGNQLRALRNKLVISGLVNDEIRVNVSERARDADITFVTVKSYDTENAARSLSRVNCGIVVSLQNGIGNEEILLKYLKCVLAGVTTYASNLIDFGHVEFAGIGETYIGDMSGEITDEVSCVVEVLKNSGINAKAVRDIVKIKWIKTVLNSAINPITAILRIKNGKILEVDELWMLAREIVREGEEVMRAMGFEVRDLTGILKEVLIKTANNRSSMLQDIERGKKTEIDFINGAIIKKAQELKLDTPYNRALYILLKGVERFGLG